MSLMSRRNDLKDHVNRCFRSVMLLVAGAGSLLCAGCQDGPLYALKAANPYFSMKEWGDDEKLGVTDHERRKELMNLAASMGSLSNERQAYWIGHLEQVMENDQSAEMRRLAVNAAGRVRGGSARGIIKLGMKDDSTKVRMEACRALEHQNDEESALLLAETLGSETELDVRHAAMTSLGKYKSPIAIDSLRVTLNDRNPATRTLAVNSLRKSTGKDYGNDPQVWIAALDGKSPEPAEVRIADRIRNLF